MEKSQCGHLLLRGAIGYNIYVCILWNYCYGVIVYVSEVFWGVYFVFSFFFFLAVWVKFDQMVHTKISRKIFRIFFFYILKFIALKNCSILKGKLIWNECLESLSKFTNFSHSYQAYTILEGYFLLTPHCHTNT